MKTLLISLAALLMVSCSTVQKPTTPIKPEPIARGAELCKFDPAACEKSCTGCADMAACFANGGECVTVGTHYNDTADIADDIWTPGCHFEYLTSECVNGAIFLGDDCSRTDPKVLIEWTLSECHPPNGDHAAFDCDKECLKNQRGNGICVPVPNACSGTASAYCRCNKPGPTV